MPARHVVVGDIEIGIGTMVAEPSPHLARIERRLCLRYQLVKVLLGRTGAADTQFGRKMEPRAGDAAHKKLAYQPSRSAADAAGHGVTDFLRLVPDIAGQGFVGPLASQGNLVPLLMHRLSQPQE